MKLPNACSPVPSARSLREVARPQREGDDQADARAAADQQGPAVELQRAYCAFSARRSILPVPRRGSGSAEKMIRSGILNLASRAVEEGAQIRLVESAAVWQMDDRDRHFAEPLVGRAEHRRFGDVGAGVAGRLDLGRRDILAAADDDVLLAVDDEQIAVLVEIADVAGADIAVGGEQRRGRFRVAPIAFDVGRACGCAISPRSPGGRCAVAGAEDRDLDERLLRPAGRGRLGGIIAPEIAAADGVGLGQAVAERRLRIRETRCCSRSTWLTGRGAPPAVMSVSDDRSYLCAVGMVHELEAHRRHADEIGDLLLLDQPQRLARIPLGHQHHAAADDEAVEHHRHFAGDVEQGHAEQGPRLALPARGPRSVRMPSRTIRPVA